MWICLWFASEAQNSFIRYGINEGLSQLQVMQLTQDNKGYIWACTKGGISQFDGIRFTNYIIGKELLETPKTRLVFDSLGNAWFTTKHTICFFDRKNRKFHHTVITNHIWSDDIVLEILDEKIRCRITKEHVASVWLFYPKTLTLSFVRQEKLTPYLFAYNIFPTYVDCDDPSKLANDGSSLRFFARELRTVMSNDTLVYYLAHKNFAKNTYLIRQKAGKTELVGKYPGNVAIYEMNTKNKFVYYSDGKLYQHRIGQQQHCLGNVELVNDILFDTEDNLWLATEYGLQKYAPFKTFTKLDNLPDMIWATVEDKNHRVWILSYISSHLYYIDESDSFPTRIKRYQHKFKKE
ncbi:MAG: hypothetical protein RIS47_1271, partial [Bacteroidota bacterium]